MSDSIKDIASVCVPGEGLAVAILYEDNWLEYVVSVTPQSAQLWRTKLPLKKVFGCSQPAIFVTLAVNDKKSVIATVAYSHGDLVTAELNTDPQWTTLKLLNRS
jgi:hypothetical protein